jgi:hypothetical protein
MSKFRILVFPCGSEIGLEIYQSLKYSSHVELFGASSVDDHGRFVYKNYIENVPFVDDPFFIVKIKELVNKYNIEAIYPTMDKVIWKLKINEHNIGCKIISSSATTTEICLSKQTTYNQLKSVIKVPTIYNFNSVHNFPVFIKPIIGYGSRNTILAKNKNDLITFFNNRRIEEYLITEYLTGEEFTVDCFTDKEGTLRFIGPRIRNRISNGISVNTKPVCDINNEFKTMAELINERLDFRGAWFFQLKKDSGGELTLLEIASRLGGSSSLYRGKGINFALLSVFDAFNYNVEIIENDYQLELDRSLNSRFKVNIEFDTVYVDYDDCLIINNEINIQLVSFLFKAINEKKKLVLISKHEGDLDKELSKYRLNTLFDKIIHIGKGSKKFEYIDDLSSIFIDDSFMERKEVKEKLNIPVFSQDMIEILL